mgnify:CR=1 FL=1
MMDITTEVGLTYLCHGIYTVLAMRSTVQRESENLSGLHNQLESNQRTTALQILRFSASHCHPDWQVSGFQVPSPPLPSPNARHTIPPHETDGPERPESVTDARSGVARGNGRVEVVRRLGGGQTVALATP